MADPQRAGLESDGGHGTAVRACDVGGHHGGRVSSRRVLFTFQVPVPAINDPAGSLIYCVCAADQLLRTAPGGSALPFSLKARLQDRGENGDPLTFLCRQQREDAATAGPARKPPRADCPEGGDGQRLRVRRPHAYMPRHPAACVPPFWLTRNVTVRPASTPISSSLSSGDESTRIASGSAGKDHPPSGLGVAIRRRLSARMEPSAYSRQTPKYHPETHAPILPARKRRRAGYGEGTAGQPQHVACQRERDRRP
jgi:hypothetical protein